MKDENKTYLSDWLAGKISDRELQEFVSEEDFLAYQKLKNTLEDMTIPGPDMEKNFSAIQEKIRRKQIRKSKKVFPLWKTAAIAATLLLLFGLYQVFYFSNQTETAFGTTKKVTLPDDSKVTLNAKSTLAYPGFFQINRTLQLQGEAYFEVQKGSTFTVKTGLGNVKVLGTKFNVTAYNDYFEVECFEGRVKVQAKDKFTILTPTESVRFYGDTYENWAALHSEKPLWLSGESSFKKVPIRYVLNQFQNQYNVKVSYPRHLENVKYTGAFTNKNRETALKSICIPLHLHYTVDTLGNIIISE